MGVRLLVQGSTIKKPLAMCHRQLGDHPVFPHLITQRGSGEGKDWGALTHKSAKRPAARAWSLEHTEVPDSAAAVPEKGKKEKAKSARILGHPSLETWGPTCTQTACAFPLTFPAGDKQCHHPKGTLQLGTKNLQTIPKKRSTFPKLFLPSLSTPAVHMGLSPSRAQKSDLHKVF